jgi:putative addiction module killer protein
LIEIREYITPEGIPPLLENSFQICVIEKQKLRYLLGLIELPLGNFGDHKYWREGVYELRLTYGKGIRIYYGKEQDTIILLLLGGNKSTQNQDVNKAIEYWHEHTGE